MTLLQIQYFIEVYKWRSFSVAAEKNFVSQPTISTAITLLEEEIGQKLFHRGKPLSLTKEGQVFYYHCKELLEHYSFVCSFKKKEENIIRIGITPMISAVILPEIMKRTQGSEVRLSEHYHDKLIRSLKNGSIDVLFIYDTWAEEHGFAVKQIRPMQRQISAHKRFRLPVDHPIRPQDLKDVPLALRSRDSELNASVRSDFEKVGVEPNIICETDQIKTLEQIITSGIGAAFLDAALFKLYPEVLSYPYRGEHNLGKDLNIALAYKKGVKFPPHIQKFIDAF